jgi:hypothetical protein
MSAASIPGTSDTLVAVLRSQLEARLGPGRDGYEVQLFRSADFTNRPTGIVSLLLYRVDVDEARRFADSSAGAATRQGTRWLGLELSYLLTVWGRESATGEQRMLQHCMEILQEMAIVQGAWLHPSHSWDPDDALRISLAPMNHEDLMRLWDGFDLPYQLSIPYLVRTVRIAARPLEEVPVISRTLAFGSGNQP